MAWDDEEFDPRAYYPKSPSSVPNVEDDFDPRSYYPSAFSSPEDTPSAPIPETGGEVDARAYYPESLKAGGLAESLQPPDDTSNLIGDAWRWFTSPIPAVVRGAKSLSESLGTDLSGDPGRPFGLPFEGEGETERAVRASLRGALGGAIEEGVPQLVTPLDVATAPVQFSKLRHVFKGLPAVTGLARGAEIIGAAGLGLEGGTGIYEGVTEGDLAKAGGGLMRLGGAGLLGVGGRRLDDLAAAARSRGLAEDLARAAPEDETPFVAPEQPFAIPEEPFPGQQGDVYRGPVPVEPEYTPSVNIPAERDFLRPDLEASINAEQARLTRRYLEHKGIPLPEEPFTLTEEAFPGQTGDVYRGVVPEGYRAPETPIEPILEQIGAPEGPPRLVGEPEPVTYSPRAREAYEGIASPELQAALREAESAISEAPAEMPPPPPSIRIEEPIPWGISPETVRQNSSNGIATVEVPITDLLGLAKEDIERPGRAQAEKLARARNFLFGTVEQTGSVHTPEVSVKDGRLIIEDGYHRAQAALEAGEATVPVRIPREDLAKLRDLGLSYRDLLGVRNEPTEVIRAGRGISRPTVEPTEAGLPGVEGIPREGVAGRQGPIRSEPTEGVGIPEQAPTLPTEKEPTIRGKIPEPGNVRMPSILPYREGEPVSRRVPPKAPEIAGDQLRAFIESDLSDAEIRDNPWLSQEAKDLITAERIKNRPETLTTERQQPISRELPEKQPAETTIQPEEPKFAATQTAPLAGVTTDQIKQAFASGKVSGVEGGWDVSLPDKGQLSVKVTPEGIEYAEGAFKAGRGREKGGAEEIVGSYQRAGKDAIIMLSSKADLGTLHHEAWHDAKTRALEADPSFAEKLKAAFRLGKLGALSKGELEAVYKRYEPDAIVKAKSEGVDFASMDESQKRAYVEEVEADKYGEWNPKTQVNGWFSKIFNFMRRLYRSFRPNWESAFERIRSGEAYGKPTETNETLRKFAVARREAPFESLEGQQKHKRNLENELNSVRAFIQLRARGYEGHGETPVESLYRQEDQLTAALRETDENIASLKTRGLRPNEAPPKFATKKEGFTAPEEPFSLPTMGRIVPKKGIKAPKEPPKPTGEERGTIFEMGVEGWKANLLTGLPTQGANTAGNILKQALTIAETALSSRVIDPALAKLQGRARERFKGEAAASFAAVRSAGPTAIKQFVKDLGEIATLKPEKLQGEGRYEYKRAIPGKTGRAVRIPFRLLEAGDTAMKTLAGEQELYKQALRKFEGKAEKAGDFIKKYNSMPEAERKIAYPKVFEAIEKAKERETFQGPLDDRKFIEGAAQMISNASQKYPVLDFVFPFKKTPAKIATATLERTPYGFKYAWDKYKEFKAGKAEAGEVSDALARPILGTAIAAVMGAAASDGLITGSGPSDARKRYLLEETGWKPYSFVTEEGGKKVYTPYNRLEPISSVVGMVADFIESGNEKEAGDLIDKIGGSVMENLTNKTFLAGLDGLSHAMSDPRRYLGQFAKNLAGSFVPTGVAKAAQALDPTVRYTKADEPGLAGLPETIGRTIQARIPGLSQKLPALKSPTGEDVQRPGTAFERFVSPAIRSKEREGKDLEKLMVDIDYVPGQPHREMTVRHKKIRLNEEEYAIMQKSNKLAADYIRRNLLTSPSFMRADPEMQKRAMEKIYSKARNQAKSKIQSMKSFRERALAPQ